MMQVCEIAPLLLTYAVGSSDEENSTDLGM